MKRDIRVEYYRSSSEQWVRILQDFDDPDQARAWVRQNGLPSYTYRVIEVLEVVTVERNHD
jgi:hypothetical protein